MTDIEHPDQPVSFVSHMQEMRRRLLIAVGAVIAGFILCYIFKEPLFSFMVAPLVDVQGGEGRLIFTGVAEFFFTYLKLSFLGGLFMALPIFLWEGWRFAAPGLYQEEKRMVAPFLVATPLLFYLGGVFTYFVIMPIVIEFFFQFQTTQVIALPSVKEYLTFFTKLVFAFGLAFELPVFLLLLAKAGVVTSASLASFRRYAIVFIFVAAALLTPPDPASQLLLAIPLILLYELSVFGAKFVQKNESAKTKKSTSKA